jgi:hypothetical protein
LNLPKKKNSPLWESNPPFQRRKIQGFVGRAGNK